MANFAGAVPLLYERMGDEVTYTPAGCALPVVARAIFSAPGQSVLGGEAIVTDYTLRYPTAALPGVVRGDRFVRLGTTFEAREAPVSLNDGAEAIVALRKVSP